MRKVYYNGKFIDESEASISIYDSALMFGDMVFEMTRSFNKIQFRMEEHIDRLYASAKYLRIDLEDIMSKEEMLSAVNDTIRVNEEFFDDDDEHRIMIDVTRGLLGIYKGVVGSHEGINVIIADFPLKWTVRGMGRLFDTGINAVIPSQRAIPASLIDPKAKNRSRIHYLMANMQVAGYEGDNNWALLLDTDNHIAEGTGDNFFMVKDGVLLTPEPRNILKGISRQFVIELAGELGIEVRECNLDVYDLVNADEAFLTGTPFCMLPMTTIDRQPIGKGIVGPVYRQLLKNWSQKINLDIEQQIKHWDEISKETVGGVTPYSFKSK